SDAQTVDWFPREGEIDPQVRRNAAEWTDRHLIYVKTQNVVGSGAHARAGDDPETARWCDDDLRIGRKSCTNFRNRAARPIRRETERGIATRQKIPSGMVADCARRSACERRTRPKDERHGWRESSNHAFDSGDAVLEVEVLAREPQALVARGGIEPPTSAL